MERQRQRPARFLDEPHLVVLVDLDRVIRELRALAKPQGLLPERMRQQVLQILRTLTRMRRELRDQPDRIEAERLRDQRERS